MGCPSLIISDQDWAFNNEMSDLLFTKTNAQHRVTSAYHPQTNSSINHTLSNCLVAKTNDSQNDLDDKLNAILFSYCFWISTKHFLMFGWHPCLPTGVEYEASESDLVKPTDEDIERALENLLSARKEAKELASKNIKKHSESKMHSESKSSTMTERISQKFLRRELIMKSW